MKRKRKERKDERKDNKESFELRLEDIVDKVCNKIEMSNSNRLLKLRN